MRPRYLLMKAPQSWSSQITLTLVSLTLSQRQRPTLIKHFPGCRSVDYVSKSFPSLTPMLKMIFKGGMHRHSRYEELTMCWLAALARKKEALHELVLAQKDIEVLENGFCRIIGPKLVHYYRRAYYRGEDTSTIPGKL